MFLFLLLGPITPTQGQKENAILLFHFNYNNNFPVDWDIDFPIATWR